MLVEFDRLPKHHIVYVIKIIEALIELSEPC